MLNRTLELFRRTGSAFTKFPVLWLPLVIADVLRSVLQWYSRPVTRAVLLASAPRSAIGGGIAGLPSPAKIALITNSINFVTTVLALFFYLYALGVVARALRPNGRQLAGPLHGSVPSGIGGALLRASGLALLFQLFTTGLVNGVLLPSASRARLHVGTIQAILWCCLLPVLAAMLYLSIPFLRTFVLRQQDDPAREAGPRVPFFILLLTCTLVSYFAAIGLTLLTGHVPIAPTFALLLLQIVASVVTSFPYAYAMTGLSVSLPQDEETPA